MKDDLKNRLESLKRELTGISSMLAMMEKGTKSEDLAKMRRETVDPIREEIRRLEGQIGKLV